MSNDNGELNINNLVNNAQDTNHNPQDSNAANLDSAKFAVDNQHQTNMDNAELDLALEPQKDIDADTADNADNKQSSLESLTTQQLEEVVHKSALNIWNTINTEASVQNPDLGAAANFIKTHREKQLEKLAALYPEFNDPAVREKHLAKEWTELMVTAAKADKNPIELVYILAEANGYSRANNLSDKIQRIDQAQEAAKTITNGASGIAMEALEAEQLSQLPDHEFSKLLEKNPNLFKRLVSSY